MKKNSLYALLFTLFNDAVGWGVVLTIFAPLFFDKTNPIISSDASDNVRNFLVGMLIGSYAVTQFIFMPMIGALSDHFGRKKVIEWTLLGACASFVLSALAVMWTNLVMLFAARLFAGLFSANVGTAQASIADMSTEQAKAKNLSLSGIVGGIAWIVGPSLGGFLSTSSWVSWFDFATPFWVLALLFFLNYLWIYTSYSETHKGRGKHDWKQEIRDLAKISKIPRMKSWLVVAFLFYFGWFFFVLYYPTLFVQTFHFMQEQIGYISSYLAFFWMIGSWLISKWMGENVRAEKAIIWTLPAMAILLLIGNGVGTILSWIWIFPLLSFGGTLCWINTMAAVSNIAGKSNQGKAFGILQSMMSLATFLAPLCTGLIALYSLTLPIYIGAAVLLVAAVYARGIFYD